MSSHKSGLSDHHDKFDPAEERADGVEENTTDDDDEFDQIPIRPRKRFTVEETEDLERTYKQYERPPAKVKQNLADRFNTTVSRIQIWFQNRRAKAKKMCPIEGQYQPDNVLEDGPKRLKVDTNSQQIQSTSSSSSAQESSARPKRKRGKQTRESQEFSYYGRPPNIAAPSSELLYNSPVEFFNSISLPSTDRFIHPNSNRPELTFKAYPRLFQELQPCQQFNVAPAGHFSPFYPGIGPGYGNSANNFSTFIDPQKMSYSKEGEPLSRPMALYNEIQPQALVADDSIDGDINEDFDETKTKGLTFGIYGGYIEFLLI